MKNCYYILFLFLLAALPVSAQQGVDLDFRDCSIRDSNGDKVTSVVTGNTYRLTGTIVNNSGIDFEGYITLNVSIRDANNYDWPGRENETADLVFKFKDAQDKEIMLNIPAYGKMGYDFELYIDPKIFNDTNGIVITWPTISYSDESEGNNYGILTVDVIGSTGTGIGPDQKDLDFSIYPNPAEDQITMQAGNWSNALVTISDLQGRQLNAWRFEHLNGDKVVLPLSLPSGIYMMQVQTPEGTQTQRLTIK